MLLLLACFNDSERACAEGYLKVSDGSCVPVDDEDDPIDTGGDTGGDTGEDEVSWTKDIFPIYAVNCGDCHEDWGGPKDPDTVYDWLLTESVPDGPIIDPGSHSTSFLWNKVAEEGERIAGSQRMPMELRLLSEADLGTVERWIESGAEDDSEFADIEKLFKEHSCENCHADWYPGLYESLTTLEEDGYDLVVPGDPSSSYLYLKLSESEPPFGTQMPQRFEYLSDEQVQLIADWIDQGAIEN